MNSVSLGAQGMRRGKLNVIAAMIFLAKVKDPAKKLLALEQKSTKRHDG